MQYICCRNMHMLPNTNLKRENNKKSGCEGKGKRSTSEKKGLTHVPILFRYCLYGPIQLCYLFDVNAVTGICWTLTTIKPV